MLTTLLAHLLHHASRRNKDQGPPLAGPPQPGPLVHCGTAFLDKALDCSLESMHERIFRDYYTRRGVEGGGLYCADSACPTVLLAQLAR